MEIAQGSETFDSGSPDLKALDRHPEMTATMVLFVLKNSVNMLRNDSSFQSWR